MFIISHRNIFFAVSAVSVLFSVAAIAVGGLQFGIDFTGGSLVEVFYENGRPELSKVEERLRDSGFKDIVLQSIDDRGLLVRTETLDEASLPKMFSALSLDGKHRYEEKRLTSIGPVIGRELKRRAFIALGVSILLTVIFIAFSFRHVSQPVSSWKYGVVAILTLLHDVVIPTGIFVVLGRVRGAEVDTLFVTALLAILGLSINDTIVVFDRIRENLRLRVSKSFSETVGVSLKQTMGRSFNTSFTALLVLVALYLFGPHATRDFALVLGIGLLVGAYSSIFVASPLLVEIEKRQKKK